MDSSNHWYGHAHILAEYCGLDPDAPPRIDGVLQHGWTFVHGFGYGHRPPWVSGVGGGRRGGGGGAGGGGGLGVARVLCTPAGAAGGGGRRAAGAGGPPVRGGVPGSAATPRRYVVVTTVFGAVVAVVDAVGLVILGVPLALLWGLVSFLTNYVPNIGFFLGLAPPTLLALLVSGPGTAVIVIVLYCVANFVIQSVIQPVFVGDAVGLSVTLSFLSVVLWTVVLGPLGAVLAIPLTLFVHAVLVAQDPYRRWAAVLLAGASGGGSPQRRRRRRKDEAAADPVPALRAPGPAQAGRASGRAP